jgi:UDP-N-acetylmuramyl pentapeptide phosphotransferase/UDP-N-acetylglucosamine-1-phosphate transferase
MPLIARSGSRAELSVLPVVAIVFVWFFVFDTVFTFIRRLLARRRVWEAHREHIYQKLVIEGQQHSFVTVVYGLASALLCAAVLLAIGLSGVFQWLVLVSLAVPTLLMTYLGVRKKR